MNTVILNHMVDYSSETLDRSLYALSDPTRRAILARIVHCESTVSELAEPFNMSLAAVSKHLKVLERAKFLKKSRSGRTVKCSATLNPLGEVIDLLEDLAKYWNKQLDSLEEYLSKNEDFKGVKNHGQQSKHAPKTSNSKGYKSKKRKGL